jgi:2-succinyl-5-enolpyruvyl-6-hydroxy-3-cyclohexene-1-carboxylate synthase
MPTSKELRTWLTQTQPQQWVIDKSDRNLDPLHLPTTHLRHPIEHLLPFFSAQTEQTQTVANTPPIPPLPHSPTYPPSPYLTHWLNLETQFRQTLDQNLSTTAALFEGKVAWLLSQSLPSGTPLFIANSTPVRDMEWFWQPGNRAIRPYFNRGANGIDGTLSTALGIAHRHRSTVLLTGDLALLHDTNGFLLRHKLVGHLTIVLINNDGGGIFEMLAIAQFEPPFEEFFGTPQCVDIAALCCAYDIKHERITHWEQLQQRLNPLPQTGIRVLELLTDRKADAQNRKRFLETRPQ